MKCAVPAVPLPLDDRSVPHEPRYQTALSMCIVNLVQNHGKLSARYCMMIQPNIVLSIDVPGRATGGFVRWDRTLQSVSIGTLRFKQTESEAEDYRRLLTTISNQKPDLIIIEHPFLYMIAGPIGGVKAWAAWNCIPWWMVTASGAKKSVLGNGRASKKEVLLWAQKTYHQRWHIHKPETITQHQADALLYLIAWEETHEPRASLENTKIRR